MPLRLAATRPDAWRARHVAAGIAIGVAALLAIRHFIATPHHRQEAGAQAPVAAPAVERAAPSAGRWTIVFERGETCDESCTRVMDTLNAVARDPASGIPDGDAQIRVTRTQGEPARDLIVLDPEGRPAGFISHTNDAGRVVSGLATLRASSSTGVPIASR